MGKKIKTDIKPEVKKAIGLRDLQVNVKLLLIAIKEGEVIFFNETDNNVNYIQMLEDSYNRSVE